jgi:RND family efflux transporter MFP subunit
MGGPVVELADMSAVLVRVDVPEQAISFNNEGDEVRIKIDALSQWFTGRIEHVIPQAAVDARTFPVEIRIENADHVLKSGMFARATVAAGPEAPAVVVPLDAVVQRHGLDYVAVVTPGPHGGLMASPMPVRLGAQVADWVAITSGELAPGMQVVIRGNENIQFPTPVEPVTMDAFQSAALGAPQSGDAPETARK